MVLRLESYGFSKVKKKSPPRQNFVVFYLITVIIGAVLQQSRIAGIK